MAQSRAMLQQLGRAPGGVLLFLVYGFLMLAFIGLTLPLVVAQAVTAPIDVLGIIYMLLLAYLIFTLTLVLQRKQAAYPLALGLTTIGVTLIFVHPLGWFALAVAVVVLVGLRRQTSRAWFSEP
jgi:hypothetical protein